MPHVENPQSSEDDAYFYIRDELAKLGWNTRNPARSENGEVYKQNECLSNIYIKEALNLDKPEAIVLINPVDLWIIEAKRYKNQIDTALYEAKNQYAKSINAAENKKFSCKLISGVAGNDDDGFIVRSEFLLNGKWEPVLFNGKHKNILLSKEQAKYLVKNQTPNWNDFPDLPEEKYLTTAEDINSILHNAGINKNKRARFIAGLILSLSTDNLINLKIEDAKTLVNHINASIEEKLREVNKENFYDYIKLEVPLSETNHVKYRNGIIDTIKELETLDIHNAMASGTDVLGKFYEKFLKYGDGAKDIGIVLTPRHITSFAVETLDVKHNDYILDPTCGTGGFLVSAFDYVKSNSNEQQTEIFKKFNVFGIEQDVDVVSLALVNMIFRGDGKHNMEEGNCFNKNINKTIKNETINGRQRPITTGEYTSEDDYSPLITKVLMNPPFALKKEDEKEKYFIDYALSQMEDNGLLFAILPISVMTKKSDKNWRIELLNNNTLLSVITFPPELFSPSASVGTVGVYIKKGIPHDYENNKVLFVRAVNDGYEIKKTKRIQSSKAPNDLEKIKNEVKSFIHNPQIEVENIPEFKKACLLDKNDSYLELVPEYYIDSKIPDQKTIEENIEDLVKSCACYIIKNR